VAIFDRRALTGTISVRFASGDELFTDLGSGASESPDPGEVVFVDETGGVCARRWCWRQSAESAAGPETTEILVTVEGQHETAAEDVAAARRDLEELLRTYAVPAGITAGTVDARNPVF
jgi:DNA/RNA-binding domain of Phe-tRNA-synthetase-like protein